jgi:hypothetical protein
MSFKGLYRDADYGLVHKDIALFSKLSLKARGLYAVLACWPTSERLSISAVLRVVPDGRDAVTGAWRELQSAGMIGPKISSTKVGITRKKGLAKDAHQVKKSDCILQEIQKSPTDEHNMYNNNNLTSNEDNERTTILRKSSVGTLEAFMSLKVATDADAAGIDVEHYFNAILEWSNKKNRQLRTAHGWMDTIKGAIRRDKQAGKLKMKGQAETQQDDQLRFLQLGR